LRMLRCSARRRSSSHLTCSHSRSESLASALAACSIALSFRRGIASFRPSVGSRGGGQASAVAAAAGLALPRIGFPTCSGSGWGAPAPKWGVDLELAPIGEQQHQDFEVLGREAFERTKVQVFLDFVERALAPPQLADRVFGPMLTVDEIELHDALTQLQHRLVQGVGVEMAHRSALAVACDPWSSGGIWRPLVNFESPLMPRLRRRSRAGRRCVWSSPFSPSARSPWALPWLSSPRAESFRLFPNHRRYGWFARIARTVSSSAV